MTKPLESHPLENKKAPALSLESGSGDKITLSQFKGNIVVLYFYPRDNTPGCTVEANAFREVQAELAALGATVLGVSPDSPESHCKFAAKFQLNFHLLSDPTHNTAEKYGVWVEKNMYGKKCMGIQRTTFLINRDGKICRVWNKVKPEGHGREVLEAVKELVAS